jgi:uroporphyrinogen-III synthase
VKVLITRAEPEAARLAGLLAARGVEALIEPLLHIRHRAADAPLPPSFLDGVQALLFTSANGARAFAAASARRDLRVFAVGDASAATSRACGFAQVESACGNVEDLAALVIARLRPGDGALVHAAGGVTAGDLAGVLEAAGFSLRRAVLYDAVPATALSAATRAALETGALTAALFFSPRTAASFVRLAAGMEDLCRSIIAVALSPAVAAALAPLPWRRVAVAATPDEPALLRALEQSFATERSS